MRYYDSMLRRVAYRSLEAVADTIYRTGAPSLDDFAHGERAVAFVYAAPKGGEIVEIVHGDVCSTGDGQTRLFMPDEALPLGERYATRHPTTIETIARWTGGRAVRLTREEYAQMNVLNCTITGKS